MLENGPMTIWPAIFEEEELEPATGRTRKEHEERKSRALLRKYRNKRARSMAEAAPASR
jgi:hypothetical protein